MSKPIPLAATLSIERQDIVVDRSWRLVDDAMLVRVSAEAGERRLVQWPVERDSHTLAYLFGGGRRDSFGREEIQHAELVGWAEQAPCVAFGAILAESEGVEGREVVFCVFGHDVG